MAVSRLSSCVAFAAAAASLSTLSGCAYADSPFRFYPFSSSPPQGDQSSDAKSEGKTEAEESRGSGFDAESLERGAKALREINSSPFAKQVFQVMRKQEDSRLAELSAEKAHFEAIQAQADIVSDYAFTTYWF